MDGEKPKRGRGRPRKTAQPIAESPTEPSVDQPIKEDTPAHADEFDIERELQRAMESQTETMVFNPSPSDAPNDFPDDEFLATQTPGLKGEPVTKAQKVKKMSSTTRKMMKFGYTQLLRAAEPITKGKVPGEKMAYIVNNDEQAEAILDEILTELDQKYKVEQYFNPESKLAMFTAQLFIQAKNADMTRQQDVV